MPPRQFEDYEVIDTLDKGPLGFCLKVRSKKNGNLFLWKEVTFGHMVGDERQILFSELNLLHQLKHPNILKCIDSIVSRRSSKLYVVTEYFHGNVSSLILRHKTSRTCVDESLVWKILFQVTQALHEYHIEQTSNNIVLPCDLKPSSVFLSEDNEVKLQICGLTGILTRNFSSNYIRKFTSFYMAPEQVCGLCCSEKSDVWSLGCLLYELCSLRTPFTSHPEPQWQVKIGSAANIPSIYSDTLRNVIGWMLTFESELRPDLGSILAHPFFNNLRQDPVSRLSNLSLSSLEEKEKALKTKEIMLKQKERQLEEKEKLIAIKEKLLNTCLREGNSSKASEVQEERVQLKSSSLKRGAFLPKNEFLHKTTSSAGILMASKKSDRVPKHVHFKDVSLLSTSEDKENIHVYTSS